MLLVLALSIAAGLSSALLIAMIGNLFTNLEAGVPLLWVFVIVVLVLALTAFELLSKKVLLKHSESIAHQLRLDFAQWRIAEPLEKVEPKGAAAPLASFSEDIKRVTMALEYIPEVCVSLTAICGATAYLFFVSAPVILFAAVAVLPAAWVFMKIQVRVRESLIRMLASRNHNNTLFRSMLLGEKELKLDPKRADTILNEHLATSSKDLSNHAERLALMYNFGNLWTQLCYFTGIVAILALLATGLIDSNVVAPYVLVALFLRSYIYRFMAGVPHWTAAGAVLSSLQTDGYVFGTSSQTLAAASVNQPTSTELIPALKVDVKDVCYEYVSERDTTLFTAGPFNLNLNKPEILFVTGQNGIGKSTFLKILCGLYPAKSGHILFNGAVVSNENIDHYRQNFSALFTVPHVFPEVPISVPSSPEKRRRFDYYLKELGLDGKIQLDRSSYVSELSHGQLKRLALLTTLMDDRPVVIFDEWAENQDPAFKKIFYYQILPELRAAGRIVVAVTHESNYFDAADRIYTMSS